MNCVCGHAREVHQHYRRGSDCGVCGHTICSRYRRARLWFWRNR